MAENAPYGRKTQRSPAISEVHILWITAGLGCDGDSVSITAATEPSIEDIILGSVPGLPKVHLHNPVLAYEVGDEFLEWFHKADRGELENFVLVVEGSIPNEHLSGDGYWAAMGTDAATGQPIKTTEWIDRLAPKALGVVAAGTCATYGGIHAMKGNPTGCMGIADYLGWDWKSKAGLPIVNVPGCPVQPDNFMETLLYLLRQLAGLAPMIPLDDALRPKWLFGMTVHQGCDRAAITSRRISPTNMARGNVSSKLAVGDPSFSATCRNAAGSPASADARTLAAFASAAPCPVFRTSSCRSWTNRRARASLRYWSSPTGC